MAAIDKVTIGNMALSHVGADSTIESFEEKSAEANAVELWYDLARKETLEAFNWNFARTTLIMALHAEAAPEALWDFRYQYPSDALKIREMENPAGKLADRVSFTIQLDSTKSTKTILTNLEDAVAIYTFDLETTALFSSHFIQTLSRLLASRIAQQLTNKKKIADDNFALYLKMIGDAASVDANEEVFDPPREAEWIRAR